MLEVKDLACVRGDRCLFSGVSFTLTPGELLYLHGPNGCGKTTLLRTLCGLTRPESGSVSWGGEAIQGLGEEFVCNLAYVGHLNGIKGDLTGVENLRADCALNGHPIDDITACDTLSKMGLQPYLELPAKVLSQGQKRRVALARLLVSQARLWILDEPFTALDQAALERLQMVIQQHLERGGMVVLTTHQRVELTKSEAKQLYLGSNENG